MQQIYGSYTYVIGNSHDSPFHAPKKGRKYFSPESRRFSRNNSDWLCFLFFRVKTRSFVVLSVITYDPCSTFAFSYRSDDWLVHDIWFCFQPSHFRLLHFKWIESDTILNYLILWIVSFAHRLYIKPPKRNGIWKPVCSNNYKQFNSRIPRE